MCETFFAVVHKRVGPDGEGLNMFPHQSDPAMTVTLDSGDIRRFTTVKNHASYYRYGKYKIRNGKRKGSSNNPFCWQR
jgi:hypothetical protein